MINQIDETDRGILDFPAFLKLIREKLAEVEDENQYKDAFRVFSKDNEGGLVSRSEVTRCAGCIPAGEMRSVLSYLPGITQAAIEQMIAKVAFPNTSLILGLLQQLANLAQVDRDGDGRISYSEFRVMMGGHPLIVR